MSKFLSPIMDNYTDLIKLIETKVDQLNSAELNKQGIHFREQLSDMLENIRRLNLKELQTLTKLDFDLETFILALLTSNAGGIIKQLSQVFPRTNENLLLERKVRLAEQMSLIGDAALKTAFHTYLSELPPDEVNMLSKILLNRTIDSVEGTLTLLVNDFVSNKNQEKLWLSWSIEEKLGSQLKPNIATHPRATVVEALIGALFLQNKFRIIVDLIPDWINLIKQKKK